MTRPTPAEIEAARTPGGGWTREQLAAWGVPWPPPKGWRERLEKGIGPMTHDWQMAPATGLEAAIASFKATLPGWWFRIGECQVSADASCAPTRESPHLALIHLDARFDHGFDADLAQPATMADALADVQAQALAAIAALNDPLPRPD